MVAVLMGFITGFLMCIPVGPVNLWVVNLQIKRSRKEALALALGGAVMDFFYFIFILSGISFIEFDQKVSAFIKALGLLFILILGIKEFMTREIPQVRNQKGDGVKKGMVAAFAWGVVIYTSNPTLILTMTALAAFIKELHYFEMNAFNIGMVSTFLGIGSFCWFVFLTNLVKHYEEKIRDKYLFHFSRITGLLMIVFSLVMGYKLLRGLL